jgi:hypothetical protein
MKIALFLSSFLVVSSLSGYRRFDLNQKYLDYPGFNWIGDGGSLDYLPTLTDSDLDRIRNETLQYYRDKYGDYERWLYTCQPGNDAECTVPIETQDKSSTCTAEHIHELSRKGRTQVRYDAEQSTWLMFFVIKEHYECVEALVDHGVWIDRRTDDGMTALMFAVQTGNLKIVQLLLENGAEVNWSNNYDITPLMYASAYGDSEMVKLLLRFGAYINSRDLEGRSALGYALDCGHFEIAGILSDVDHRLYVAFHNGEQICVR